MLEVIKGLPDNVVAITVTGRVTNEECDNVLRPAMERSLRRHNKIRLYYEVGSRFPGAGWDDLDIAIDHLPQWERIAVVSDTAWVRHTVNALRFLIASEVHVFTMLEAQEGRAWITSPLDAERPAHSPPLLHGRKRCIGVLTLCRSRSRRPFSISGFGTNVIEKNYMGWGMQFSGDR